MIHTFQVNSQGITSDNWNLKYPAFSEIEIAIAKQVKEQELIASFFTNLDRLITLHQKKCFEWKKRDFTSVPISWEQRKFKELCDMVTVGIANSATQAYSDSGIPMIRNQNIKPNYLDDVDIIYIRPEFEVRYKNKRLKKKDLLVVRTGYPGTACVVPEKYENSQTFTTLIARPKKSVDSYYLCQYLNSDVGVKYFESTQIGGGQKNSGAGILNEMLVSVPPTIKEEKEIADYFDSLDHLITLHQRKLELLKRLRNSLVDRCFIGEKYTMSKLILYHGSPNRVIVPKFGFGEDRHDYGRGFYLTENLELAKEWAVCRPDETNGWVHKYELEMDGLNILDFQKYDVLSWLAELMKHRDAADSRRYKMLAQKFIEKYGIDTCGYDVITGWRANASYFYIAKEFVRDNIDIEILEELLSLGGLGIQFCIKSERAFEQLSEVEQDIMNVDYSEFNDRYNERDINARNKMRALVDSDANKVTHVFSTLFER